MVYEFVVFIRNQIIHFFYRNIFKPIFFLIDPESIHNNMVLVGRILGSNFLTRFITRIFFSYSNKKLEQTILGIRFKNPVGLAAGFDKEGMIINILGPVGFGFTEVGTITGEKCAGNPKPRLWRIKKDNSLIVNYGLKNDGSEIIFQRLVNQKLSIPTITSIGKTNCKDTVNTKAGIKDYVKAFNKFTNIGDFFDINISCPNTFGGLPFSDPKKLDQLLTYIDQIYTKKPIFIKMPPDLTEKQVDSILEVVKKHQIAGFICSNLTKKDKNGGLSGKLVEELSNKQISYIYQKTKGKYVIIGVGGIFSAEDAYKKIKLGASLVQLITGMIFEGPQLISEINQGLVKLLKQDGYTNISEAVGKNIN